MWLMVRSKESNRLLKLCRFGLYFQHSLLVPECLQANPFPFYVSYFHRISNRVNLLTVFTFCSALCELL